jgi:hypothetical protein
VLDAGKEQDFGPGQDLPFGVVGVEGGGWCVEGCEIEVIRDAAVDIYGAVSDRALKTG